jgi:hypothetical protein
MSLTAPERETIIRFNDEDEVANVWTAQRPVITKLKRNPAATLLDEGNHDGSVWAEFELPKSLISFRSARVKRQLTEEQKAQARLNIQRAREARIAG